MVLGINTPDLTQIFSVLQNINTAINNLQQTLAKVTTQYNTSSAAWTPGSITSGSQATKVVSCPGSALGMWAQAAFSLDAKDLILTAYVNASGSVTVVLGNLTGSTVTIGAGTVTVWTGLV